MDACAFCGIPEPARLLAVFAGVACLFITKIRRGGPNCYYRTSCSHEPGEKSPAPSDDCSLFESSKKVPLLRHRPAASFDNEFYQWSRQLARSLVSARRACHVVPLLRPIGLTFGRKRASTSRYSILDLFHSIRARHKSTQERNSIPWTATYESNYL
jgi:hypothetical protein